MRRVYDNDVAHCSAEAKTHHGRVIGWERTPTRPTRTSDGGYRYWTVRVCDACGSVWMDEEEFVVGSHLEPEE